MRPLLLGLALLVCACSSGGPAETARHDAEVYSAVVARVAADVTPPGTALDKIVYVTGAASNKIGLEVQAAMVDRLDPITVRFVDDRAEAIDSAAPGDPVLHDGLLVALTKIDRLSGNRARVGVDTYQGVGTDRSRTMVVEPDGKRWVVTGTS